MKSTEQKIEMIKLDLKDLREQVELNLCVAKDIKEKVQKLLERIKCVNDDITRWRRQ